MKILILISIILLVSCSKGPEKDKLKAEVQDKLNIFSPSLFSVKEFTRRGSYTYDNNGPNLLVYFKSEIILNSNYKFNNWDQLGAKSLITLLGSTPSGVVGINPLGNKSGDILTVYGSKNYKEINGNWIDSPMKSTVKKKLDKKSGFVTDLEAETLLGENSLPAHTKHLKRLSILANKFQKSPKHLKTLQNELRNLVNSTEITADLTKNYNGLVTGELGGEYYLLGKAIENTLPKSQKYKSYSTSGSLHNLSLVSKGEVKFGIAQGDILQHKAENNLRAIMALYPEAIHVVCLDKSNIKKLKDLNGMKVNIGPEGSGSHLNAINLLSKHSIGPKNMSLSMMEIQSAMEALKNGTIDALIFTGGYPFGALVELANQTPIRLIPVGMTNNNKLKLKIAKNTYPGQRQDYFTIGTTAVLFSSTDVSSASVSAFLTNLFKHQKKLTQNYAKGVQFSKNNWREGISIPIHSGANQFFK